jgi:hypothetical protein
MRTIVQNGNHRGINGSGRRGSNILPRDLPRRNREKRARALKLMEEFGVKKPSLAFRIKNHTPRVLRDAERVLAKYYKPHYGEVQLISESAIAIKKLREELCVLSRVPFNPKIAEVGKKLDLIVDEIGVEMVELIKDLKISDSEKFDEAKRQLHANGIELQKKNWG